MWIRAEKQRRRADGDCVRQIRQKEGVRDAKPTFQ